MPEFDYTRNIRGTIAMERDAVDSLLNRLEGDFDRACATLIQCPGRIVVTGMRKSGHIGRTVAATLASTGSPAFFVHPGEASHGAMGMLTARDVRLAPSNSGNTAEAATLLPRTTRL